METILIVALSIGAVVIIARVGQKHERREGDSSDSRKNLSDIWPGGGGS